ncbi:MULTISPECIES: acetamidase/formamidase family protein [Ornithinibacillus]|uniref:Acetamidase/formamidase family protein n=2 Tax=Ornithinibacillus TaxID=484508 RepID=A0A923L8Y4_9BACI|nr:MULTISPECIES: acetamidase/formamidase family protein [Ornithinibacillus]MBC5638757.1 acetamidase/formamidase family protein [Ornithinibacillus hominis]MBS3679878.1 acetamidase/formamidase family protein [Ornithinibacillus massiliensis]
MTKIHQLSPSSKSLHGFFSKDLEPALEIDSGDTVHFKTLDSAWGVAKRKAIGEPRERFSDVQPHRIPKGFGHSLIGPINIKQASPGQTLEVQINEIIPGLWGWTSAGGFPSYWNQRLGMVEEKEVMLDFELDTNQMIGKSQFGNFDFTVKLTPFMGIMGMPPSTPGQHTTISPRSTGGNIDCKELQAGSILYLPIEVEGGLFSTGDGHAAQGDGEVSGPALECPMEKVSLTFNVLDDFPIQRPMAKTKDGWLTMAFHENLEEAMWIALDDMLQLISNLYNISRTEAYAYASLVVDLRVTQIVNTAKGVHAFLPFDALR